MVEAQYSQSQDVNTDREEGVRARVSMELNSGGKQGGDRSLPSSSLWVHIVLQRCKEAGRRGTPDGSMYFTAGCAHRR